jgi:hypothetical protein
MTLAGFLAAPPLELVVRHPMTLPSIPARGVVPPGAGGSKVPPGGFIASPPARAHESTDPTVDSQITSLRASGADVLLTAAIPRMVAQTYRAAIRRPLEF